VRRQTKHRGEKLEVGLDAVVGGGGGGAHDAFYMSRRRAEGAGQS
jgi:hypothetical protein